MARFLQETSQLCYRKLVFMTLAIVLGMEPTDKREKCVQVTLPSWRRRGLQGSRGVVHAEPGTALHQSRACFQCVGKP